MRRIILMLCAALMTIPMLAQIRITTPNTELLLKGEKGGELQILHYGSRLSDSDMNVIEDGGTPNHNAYPSYGLWPSSEAAFAVTHFDGNMSTVLRIEDVSCLFLNRVL